MEDDTIDKGDEFISLFDRESVYPEVEDTPSDNQGDEKIDIETETRRIFEEAYREGEKAGFEMGMKRAEPIIKRLNTYIDALSLCKEEMLKRAETLSVELALIFAEAIILKECEEKRDIIIEMAKKALEICEDKYDIMLRIRKDDIKYLSEELVKSMKIVPDDTIKDPGFVIETNFGDIDGNIYTQIDELRKRFLT
ncbi:MAG: FliH/SctL family protein [Syntrophorhabdaceae bacterium]|nr:FliH/SctL family protein [Syntrophorhabdaceae bacterium]